MVKQSGLFAAPTEFERLHVRRRDGRTLIVGSYTVGKRQDRRLLYRDVVGIDMRAGPGVDVVHNLEEPAPKELGQFDHVECMSVLEHCKRPWLVAANIVALMSKGATLHLSVPFVWRVHDYPDDYWRMTISAVRYVFDGIHWEAMKYGSDRLSDDASGMGEHNKAGYRTFTRAEVFGFGRKI